MPLFGTTPGGRIDDPILSARTGIVVRTPAVYVPLRWIILGNLLRFAGWLIKRYVRYWHATVPLTVFLYIGHGYGWVPTGAFLAVLLAVGLVWWRLHPVSFLRFVYYPVKATWRARRLRKTFEQIMVTAGLSVRLHGLEVVPQLVRVRCRKLFDIVTVNAVAGQMPHDFAEHAERLAYAFGVLQVKVVPGPTTNMVTLYLQHGDPLAAIVKPLPVVEVPNLAVLPMARNEEGEVWSLRLEGNQVLVVGATGSGKGSAAWSFIRSLAGGITLGTVKVWAFDPKGGMELAAGEPMFDRFLFRKLTEMADCLDEAVQIMEARTDRLRGRTRQHVATIAEPLYVLMIDELATLTAYNPDRVLKERIKNSLALILTKGRAAGVHVIAFVQDGRKEIVSFRNLFTVRIGLRLAEPEEVDLVLRDGARDRGALCDLIPDTTPGVAYVIDSGTTTPQRIRFSYLTDADIDAMTATYPRHTVITGYVVDAQEVTL